MKIISPNPLDPSQDTNKKNDEMRKDSTEFLGFLFSITKGVSELQVIGVIDDVMNLQMMFK